MNTFFITPVNFTLAMQHLGYLRLRLICIEPQVFQSLKLHILTSNACYYFVAYICLICYNIVARELGLHTILMPSVALSPLRRGVHISPSCFAAQGGWGVFRQTYVGAWFYPVRLFLLPPAAPFLSSAKEIGERTPPKTMGFWISFRCLPVRSDLSEMLN